MIRVPVSSSSRPPKGSTTTSTGPVPSQVRVQVPVTVLPGREANWPEFVRIVIGKLPPRTDYVMQSGYGVCQPGNPPQPTKSEGPNANALAAVGAPEQGEFPVPNASAVINLGLNREHGHLTVTLYRHAYSRLASASCATVRTAVETSTPSALSATVLSCADATADAPLVFGIRTTDEIIVTAVYADGRAVTMESIAPTGSKTPEIGRESLVPVVTDRALVDLLPTD